MPFILLYNSYHFRVDFQLIWQVKAKSLSHVWLCDPMECSPPGCSVHGILLARILEWVAISFSRGVWQETIWQEITTKFYLQTREINTMYLVWNPSQIAEVVLWLTYLSNVDIRKVWNLVWKDIHFYFFKTSSFLSSSSVLRLISSW